MPCDSEEGNIVITKCERLHEAAIPIESVCEAAKQTYGYLFTNFEDERSWTMQKRRMKTAFLSFVVFALLASTFVSPGTVHVHAADEAEVLIAPAPQGEVLSTDQTVTVNGQSVPVYRALGWANSNYSFAYFDFNGTVDVEVTDGSGRSAAGAVILPHSRGIEPTRSGSTLSFSLSEPAYVSIEFGGKNKPLLLFANALEEDAPNPGDPNVIYFGPGLHTPADVGNNGLIHLKSNETLYLAPGAIVQAAVIARGDNISIKGRGILDGNAWPEKQGPSGTGPDGTGSETAGHVISARSSNHFTVEGIIIRGSWHWTIHARQSTDILIDNVKQANGRFYGDDGFDPVNSTGIIVRNSFFRNVDDNIAVKGQHAQPDGSYLPVGDMVVENNTFWSDIARNILIGDESSTPEFRNITYRNNDIIHFAQPSFRLRPGKEAVIRNILFENIRIHGAGTTGERFIELTPDINEWMTDPKTPGFIDGVTFKNIFLYGEGNEQYGEGSVLIKGYDATHTVKNVVFDNVYRYGRLLKENSLNLQVGPHVENITFTSSEPVTPPYPSNPPQVGWSASAGYSSIQGLNGWYYTQLVDGVSQNLTHNGNSWSGTGGVYIDKAKVHPGNTASNEVVRKWVAPEDLLVRISGRVSKADTSAGDGVMTSISKNDEVLWTTDLQYDDNIGKTFDVYTSVAAGDALYFTVNMKTANNWADATNFDPFIAIVDEIPPVEVAPSWTASTDYVFAQGQGYKNWYYLLLKDGVYSDHPAGSTQWWSSDGSYINGAKVHPGGNSDAVVRKWSAPSAMAVQVTGNVAKASDALSSEGDGVTVSIKKNDEIVWGPQAVAYDDSVGYAYDFPVSLAAGDALYFIVNKNTTHYHDATLFNPTITFLSEPPVWPQGSNLIAEAASSSVKLTWPAATDDKAVTAYRVYRDGALAGTVAGTARTYTVTGLSSETAYSFQVQAGDDDGNWTVDGPIVSAITLAEVKVWKASTDFSKIQGLNNWYYLSLKDGVYSPHLLGTNIWWGADGSYIDHAKIHPGSVNDTARKWTAPSGMKVRVTGDAKKADTSAGDGVIVSIVKNAETPNAVTLWGPQNIAFNDSTGFVFDLETDVAAGESLYFIISRGEGAEATHASDGTFFDPTVTFLSAIGEPEPELDAEPLGIEILPSVKASGDGWDVKLRLINRGAEAISKGLVTVTKPEQSAGAYEFPAIAPGSVQEVVIPAPGLTTDQTRIFSLNVKTDDGYSKNLLRNISALTAVQAAESDNIAIDGVINESEWNNALTFRPVLNTEILARLQDKPQSWDGEEDVSAAGYVKWDEQFLYIAVDVTDDIHYMNKSFSGAWGADSIQFSIDPGRLTGYNSIGHHRFSLSLNSETGESQLALESTDVSELRENLLNESVGKVVRNEDSKRTVYEAALKWSEILPAKLLPVAPGRTNIGFSLVVNDSDRTQAGSASDERDAFIEYMGGIAYGKTPARFGDLILTGPAGLTLPHVEPDQPTGETELPALLVGNDGSAVVSPEQWEARRQEIVELLARETYGFSPPAPEEVVSTVTGTQDAAGGKAVQSSVNLSFDTPNGEFSFPLTLTLPKGKDNVPVFVYLAFGNRAPGNLEEIIDNGFGIAQINYSKITEDEADTFAPTGLLAQYYDENEVRGADDWGKIAAWAWAASRAADYLETVEAVDKDRLAVVGWSRLGKTALWAGAQDERFFLTISNNSGAGGAAIARETRGERIEDLINSFYFWFADNYQQYIRNEHGMPFDQHFLIAAAAPRLVYISSATNDLWADPLAEFASGRAATEAYELLGLDGLIAANDPPQGGDVFHDGRIGYHLREGDHDLTAYDWQQFVAFFKKHIDDLSVTGVSLDKESATLEVGKKLTLTSTVTPADAANKQVVWSSSSNAIATVSEEGIVTGVSPGVATITATTVAGGKTASAQITVIPVDPGPGPGPGPDPDQGSDSNPDSDSDSPDTDSDSTPDESSELPGSGPVIVLLDVASHWAKNWIAAAVKAGYIAGYPDGSFRPDRSVTRAELAKMLTTAFGFVKQEGKSFLDSGDHWGEAYISAAADNGIVFGIHRSDGEYFLPDQSITREQAAVMLHRTADRLGIALPETVSDLSFADQNSISDYALPAVQALRQSGILEGFLHNGVAVFRPQETVTRAQIVKMIQELLALQPTT
jgi:hypothetical protein